MDDYEPKISNSQVLIKGQWLLQDIDKPMTLPNSFGTWTCDTFS